MANDGYLKGKLIEGRDKPIPEVRTNKAILDHLGLCFERLFGIQLIEGEAKPGHHSDCWYQFSFDVGPMVWLAMHESKRKGDGTNALVVAGKLPATIVRDYQAFSKEINLENTWLERAYCTQERLCELDRESKRKDLEEIASERNKIAQSQGSQAIREKKLASIEKKRRYTEEEKYPGVAEQPPRQRRRT